jgi:mannose-1-phosphate guanylyltransferase/mannose-6-phosphate isomerase
LPDKKLTFLQGTTHIFIPRVFAHFPTKSGYIPKSVPHRLSNPGKIPLEIIEVQNGEYVGEDDIERIEDNYGR